jgi:dTDP-4-amino-4,6-dideoxygalactose transaminase
MIGMVLTNDSEFARRVKHLATHAREAFDFYEHIDLGYNYRLSNVLAAIGRAQMMRLPAMIALRKQWRQRYIGMFSGVPGVEVLGAADSESNCWLTAIVISEKYAWGPHDLSIFLRIKGIETRPLWKPMHLQPLYQKNESLLDETWEFLFARGLVLPSGSNMSSDQWERIERGITEFLTAEAVL